MRPSSSTSDLVPGTTVAAAVAPAAWLQAMVDVECALLRGEPGLDPAAVADVEAAWSADDWDAAAMEAAGAAHATPVVPLVEELRERAAAATDDQDVRDAVHRGATSQDVVDSAAMLVAHRALQPLLAHAADAADAAAALADEHRETPVLARTLMQAALPTSFGLKAAGWMRGVDAARAALAATPLPVQLGGPVGHGDPDRAAALAERLGLADPGAPWQADRTPVAALAAALGVLAGALAKPARDVVLLAQTEVAEVREGGEGGRSSAMAHKRNAVAAISALAAAHRSPGHVATLLAGMAGEHERAAGAWQAERAALSALLADTGAAAAWAARLLLQLEVDPARMARNLAAAGHEPPHDLGSAALIVDRALRAHLEVPS